MQICPPDPALYAPKSSCPRFLLQFLLRCKCHAIQTTTFCPKYTRNSAVPGARHPSVKKKKLDDIGLYWATLDDMSRRILPKREDIGPRRQSIQTTAMAGLQTRKSCVQRLHERRTVLPGWKRRIARSNQGNCLETGSRTIEANCFHTPPARVWRLKSQDATVAKSHGIKRDPVQNCKTGGSHAQKLTEFDE